MSNSAPLGQLRDADIEAWRILAAGPAPGLDPVRQALAAALLGNVELARDILTTGDIHRPQWPHLVKPAMCHELEPEGAVIADHCGICGGDVTRPHPPIGADHEHDFSLLVEHGYTRTWRVSDLGARDHIVAHSDGLSDFSDNGNEQYALACYCGAEQLYSGSIDWD